MNKCSHINLKYLDEKDPAENTLQNKDEIVHNFENIEAASDELFIFLDQMLQESHKA